MTTAASIKGTNATHTIIINSEILDGKLWDEIKWKFGRGSSWKPENGSEFKSMGAAIGWLKKLLKKPGWPRPTIWWIYPINKEKTRVEVLLQDENLR